eukprot:1154322-Pelagomonas_calceolata.AAC.5
MMNVGCISSYQTELGCFRLGMVPIVHGCGCARMCVVCVSLQASSSMGPHRIEALGLSSEQTYFGHAACTPAGPIEKSCTVYVGKIASTLDDQALRALLDACGTVKRCVRALLSHGTSDIETELIIACKHSLIMVAFSRSDFESVRFVCHLLLLSDMLAAGRAYSALKTALDT